ncbi:siroheme synthase [includes: uroporphyrinogen-III C-methyltransferase; precorrin-2 dehydrogenase;sirohydrochlorin ferrochelatase] [Escherichia coli]|uniref:uroporphyrinogen-III C-methyltransferase n=1 Tax=Escherichia coli TaxID=562 RepID=A0A447X4Z0_ECOLX|nr:siroheme synthase [includes: uroporphyrinogen-III C-methyltransferase; precorrin-2 dehydrogenase;sirohydrochlorin ferrochelatase] [Escherichia coli]
MGERRRFWEKLFVNDRLAQSLANNDQKAITETTEQLINEPLDHRGEVVLVGAGPGDAGLLTLKGLQQIQQADVVVYDRLVSDDIMNLVRRDADRVFVGKRAGYHCVPQEEINQILLREAQKGKRVVRLKGGDPFIFGRGGEELETLCNAGHSVLGGSGYYRSFWLLCLFGYSAHASRLCPERTLNYRTLKNRWRTGLGKPGGRKTDAGVLYGVESGRDYSAKAD